MAGPSGKVNKLRAAFIKRRALPGSRRAMNEEHGRHAGEVIADQLNQSVAQTNDGPAAGVAKHFSKFVHAGVPARRSGAGCSLASRWTFATRRLTEVPSKYRG